jgi:hypothetical protein
MENQLIINGKRTDGRGPTDLRPLKIDVGIIKNAAVHLILNTGKTR